MSGKGTVNERVVHLLADPARVSEIPIAEIAQVLGQLELLKATLLARFRDGTNAGGNQRDPPVVRYVTQAEAATMFGIPLADVRYLTRRGVVPVIGKGKNKRLYPPDLALHLERCRTQRLAVRGIPDVSSSRVGRRGPVGAA